jgi:ubiquinone/menaquinone biosynthesis C-methylase UbiE
MQISGMKQNEKYLRAFPTYNDYLAKEWEMFESDKEHQTAIVQATDDIRVDRVLDIGCGAGQEMLPLIARGAFGVGIDVMREVGELGNKMFAKAGLEKRVTFVRASGNEIPFASESFDVLICRVALMFMKNKAALAEIARVLRPGGRFLLKYQAPAYYWWKFGDGFRERYIKSSIHAARVLYAGYFYQFTGRQSFGKLTAAGEIFLTEDGLRKDFEQHGMRITAEMPDSNEQTPSIVVTKEK